MLIKNKIGDTLIEVDMPNLRGIYLRGIDLQAADFGGADLSEADFVGSGLRWADFRNASLRHANLSGTSLYCADFRGADLRGADFHCADLRNADLRGAKINLQSHDLIAEILFRAAGNDVPRRMVAGLVLVSKDWCWYQFLHIESDQREWALSVLREHVDCGDQIWGDICSYGR